MAGIFLVLFTMRRYPMLASFALPSLFANAVALARRAGDRRQLGGDMLRRHG
jgi:hypothetical protein